MFELNAEQRAMLTLIESMRKRAFDSVQHSALAHANYKLNSEVDDEYAFGKISAAEYAQRRVIPTAEQIAEAASKVEIPFEVLRDYNTVGFHLPQRSGATVFAQWLLMDFMEKNPEARCLYIGTKEPDLFDVRPTKCDAFVYSDSSGYGRMCKHIKESFEIKPSLPTDKTYRVQNTQPYSLIIFDNCNYLRGRDVHFEQLLRTIHNPYVRPVQMFVHFSS